MSIFDWCGYFEVVLKVVSRKIDVVVFIAVF